MCGNFYVSANVDDLPGRDVIGGNGAPCRDPPKEGTSTARMQKSLPDPLPAIVVSGDRIVNPPSSCGGIIMTGTSYLLRPSLRNLLQDVDHLRQSDLLVAVTSPAFTVTWLTELSR